MTDDYMPRMTREEYQARIELAQEEVRSELMPDLELREAIIGGRVRDTVPADVLDSLFQSELTLRLREIDLSPEEKDRIQALKWNGRY